MTMKKQFRTVAFRLFAAMLLVVSGEVAMAGEDRWYTPDWVQSGEPVYLQNCAACHGNAGQGTFDWRRRGADGKFPPPPLNGTAHTWHHPFLALARQIKFGAPGGGGNMPPFSETLSDEEIVNVIAWFQSKWPEQIYDSWLKVDERARNSKQ